MKNRNILLGTLAGTLILAACGTPEAPPATAPATASVDTAEVAYTLDTATSTVDWTGTMAGVKSHTGTLHYTQGQLMLKGNQVAGGTFTVDMHSYLMTDTNYAKDGSKQGTRQNLMSHLMSPEFFAVDSFPTSHYEITSVDGNTAMGNMTIRGRTFPEQVKNIVVTADGKTVSATGDLTFDRKKYGVSWDSPMKDAVLNNDIVLKLELKGTAN